mmetsp:Transcript_30989/g.68712  ORF Transcript_30989/g.68712 Transcript_30989/m.68712 type:complete len:479 (+) Transcript_30989:103-1539(+)
MPLATGPRSAAPSTPESTTSRFQPDIQQPKAFAVLEAARDDARASGQYMAAAVKQSELEKLKKEEEERCYQALEAKHHDDARALEEVHAAEYDRFTQQWDLEMMRLEQRTKSQEDSLYTKHMQEHDAWKRQMESMQPKPKWSRDLLNARRIEEHLLRQRDFAKAAKVKAQADAMEAAELQHQDNQWAAKVSLEEAKLLQRHQREMEAFRHKANVGHDEVVLAQKRELDKLQKKYGAARLGLARSQAQERLQLEQAIKGWFNPKKFGLGPSPLIPAAPAVLSPMSPGAKLSVERPKRPETAPDKLQHRGSAPPTPSGITPEEGLSAISVPREEWPDSPIDGVMPGRKVWDTPDGPRTPDSAPSARTPLHRALLPKEHASRTSTPTSGGGRLATYLQPPSRSSGLGPAGPRGTVSSSQQLTKQNLHLHTRIANGEPYLRSAASASGQNTGSVPTLASGAACVGSDNLRPKTQGGVVLRMH